jgi:hypothetical protein
VFEEFKTKSDSKLDKRIGINNFECLRKLVEEYENKCGSKIKEYELQYVGYFVDACEALPVPSAIDGLLHRLDKACSGIQAPD